MLVAYFPSNSVGPLGKLQPFPLHRGELWITLGKRITVRGRKRGRVSIFLPKLGRNPENMPKIRPNLQAEYCQISAEIEALIHDRNPIPTTNPVFF